MYMRILAIPTRRARRHRPLPGAQPGRRARPGPIPDIYIYIYIHTCRHVLHTSYYSIVYYVILYYTVLHYSYMYCNILYLHYVMLYYPDPAAAPGPDRPSSLASRLIGRYCGKISFQWKILHTKSHKHEHPLENATESPLGNSSKNPREKRQLFQSEKGEVLLRGVDTLRYLSYIYIYI